MNTRKSLICGPIVLTILPFILITAAVSSAMAGEQIDLYRVTVASGDDAELLKSAHVDVFFRVSEGYLVLATERGRERLAAFGLEIQLVAESVDRRNMALDLRHDSSNLRAYPVIFQESGLTILRVEDESLIGAMGAGLAPIRTENIPVFYYRAPEFDKSAAIQPDTLGLLLDRVREDSLLSYSEYLQSFDGRLVGTYGNLQSAFWLEDKFIEFGYDSVVADTFTQLIDDHPTKCRNIIAYKIGTTYPYYHVIIGAHRDAAEYSPGADDNGSGTAGVLEIARALRDVDTKYTFVFILFDAEEEGLCGAWHYVEEASGRDDRIAFMLNMDMIAHYENDLDANIYHFTDQDFFAQLWATLADSISSINITGHLEATTGGASDHDPFMQYGYDAIFVQEYVFSSVYHSPQDSTTYMNFDYMMRMVKASLATAYVVDRQLSPQYELYLSTQGILPELLIPNTPTSLNLIVREYGGAQLVPGSVQLHYCINQPDSVAVPMIYQGIDIYSADLPGIPCLEEVLYFFSAEDDSLGLICLPASGEPVRAVSATGLVAVFEDNFGTDKGWTVFGDAQEGHWERGEPLWDPRRDYDNNGYCYTTGLEYFQDVDGGTTTLISPTIDASSGDMLIRYARWYSNSWAGDIYNDVFQVFISNNNGGCWYNVETVGPVEQADGIWHKHQFWLSDFVIPTSTVRLRFDASDLGLASHVEAAVDAVKFMALATDIRIITDNLPSWTAGFPYSYQLEAASCESGLTWTDRFGQLEGTGLTLSEDGLLSGVPERIGPVVFRAVATGQSGDYDEKILDFIIYDSLRITTTVIPYAHVSENYEYLLHSFGGTGLKTWSDRDNDLSETGIILESDGRLSGIPDTVGDFDFVARVTDAIGAFDDKQFTLAVVGDYLCGDANGDQTVNIADAVYLINYVFKGGPPPDPVCSGDANGDGNVDVGDAVYLINYVFKSGPPPDEYCCS